MTERRIENFLRSLESGQENLRIHVALSQLYAWGEMPESYILPVPSQP